MGMIVLRTATARLAGFVVGCGIFLAGCVNVVPPNETLRQEMPLNEQWRFRFGATEHPEKLSREPADWTAISLPHTWNAADGADGGGNYARGIGWYLRQFRADPAWKHRRVFIQFDGASRSAAVYLNGQVIGEHVGGFARFRFEITDALKFDADNVIAVKVSNAEDGLPPISADFTFFGGLYRGVKLFATDPLHIATLDHASDGVYVTPKKVSAAQAEVSVMAKIRNDAARTEQVRLRVELVAGDGRTVASKDALQEIAGWGDAIFEQTLALSNPRLWNGRQDPYRYTVRVSVLVSGQTKDVVTQPIGLRYFSVDPDKGFFLNGQHLDLHGVCRHQDRAGKGWAIDAADDREDFALIREMGANVIRVAHYPQSELWFDLADENGLIVWAEIPVVNEVAPAPAYADTARQQLRELIRQHYNRPGICFWGVGNETREMGESSGREKPNGPVANALIAELAALARQEDPTRLSVYASHHRSDDTKNFHTDVLGYNKYIGWYGGAAKDFAAWADELHRRFPTLRFSVSEYGAGASIAQHDDGSRKPEPGGGWHPEEYQTYFHETYWRALRERDYVWGKFIWNMFDFAADQRSEGDTSGINDKGLVTYDRKTRKDAFYFYKANWSTEPVLYIASRRFVQRTAKEVEIKVYSTAERVELFINGVSCGTRAGDQRIFRWRTELSKGVNRIEARAQGDTGAMRDECTWTLLENESK